MRVAWVSPLPPMASGIADYSHTLLPHVAGGAEVVAVSPRPKRFRRPAVPRGVGWIEPTEFARRGDGFDAVLYHLGNNPDHRYVYELATERPGVAVFHEFVLHHLLAAVLLERPATRDPARYERILRAELGDRGSTVAELRLRRIATDFEKFLFPLSGHLARLSTGIVAHSRDAAERLGGAAPGVPVSVVPHYAPPPPEGIERLSKAQARRLLGLPGEAFVVGHFGYVTRPKQPGAVVGGFARLAERHPSAQLVIVGADHSGGGMDHLLSRHGVADRVRMTGYVDLVRFHQYLRAVDAVINLRYPSAGESSGTVARALREGLPVVVSDLGSFSELPDGAVCRVEIDGDQAELVGAHLLRLAGDEAYRAEVSGAAARYAAETLDPGRCAALYVEAARRSAAGGRPATAGSAGPDEARPPIAGGAAPREPAGAMERHRRRSDDIAELVSEAATPAGTAIHLDLLYRLLLRRPAEEHALREGELAVAAGRATRADLARWILESREFRELSLIEAGVFRTRRSGEPFEPDGYHGPDTTERVVEIPWVLSRLGGAERALDVGYAYASDVYRTALLASPVERLHGVDRSVAPVPGMARTQADVRALPYRDGAFDAVVCISTIEHIGLDNVRYGFEGGAGSAGDVQTLGELERVLAPGGRLVITVPFGLRQDESWFRQYDLKRWRELVATGGLHVHEQSVYQLTERGWGRPRELAVLERMPYGVNAPAAQGVLCAVLVKPGG